MSGQLHRMDRHYTVKSMLPKNKGCAAQPGRWGAQPILFPFAFASGLAREIPASYSGDVHFFVFWQDSYYIQRI